MIFSEKEKNIIGNFVVEMEKSKSSDIYEIHWNSGTIINARCICVFESDNELEIDDPNYEEFCAISLEVLNIIKYGDELNNIISDNVLEINYHNAPCSFRKIN